MPPILRESSNTFGDNELRGFGILVSGTSNARSWVVQRNLPHGGPTRRHVIARLSELSLERGREEAAELLYRMRKGEAPHQLSRAGRNWTLRRALDEYILARPDLRPNSVSHYRQTIEGNLGDWMERTMRLITPDEVEIRHREIQVKVASRRKTRPQFVSAVGGHSANMSIRLFGMLWNFVAERDPTMPPNPTLRLRRQFFKQGRRKRLVHEAQLPAFYKAVDQLDNRIAADYIKLLLFTGMRKTECGSLTWDEVDFAEQVIYLLGSKTQNGQSLDLPLTSFCFDLLSARRSLGNAHWVFPGRRTYLVDTEDHFQQIAKISGITVSAHDLSTDLEHYRRKL